MPLLYNEIMRTNNADPAVRKLEIRAVFIGYLFAVLPWLIVPCEAVSKTGSAPGTERQRGGGTYVHYDERTIYALVLSNGRIIKARHRREKLES